MIPAGPERDKRIGIIKNEAWKIPWVQGTESGVGYAPKEGKTFKPYSTDDSTALELFKEMPEDTILLITFMGYEVNTNNRTRNAPWQWQGDTIADAVSGAWLLCFGKDGK